MNSKLGGDIVPALVSAIVYIIPDCESYVLNVSCTAIGNCSTSLSDKACIPQGLVCANIGCQCLFNVDIRGLATYIQVHLK